MTISARMGEDGNVVYNVGDVQERTHPAFTGSSSKGSAQVVWFCSSSNRLYIVTTEQKAGLTDVQPASVSEEARERGHVEAARKAFLITIDEFKDTENKVWRNVGYGDELAKAQITNQVANDMLRANEYVESKSEDLEKFSPYFPDLRSQKKADRIPVIRQKTAEVKALLWNFLKQNFKGKPIDLNLNGRILETRISTGGITFPLH